MKRTSQDSPLEEFDEEKRLWWKVDDIDENLYNQHYKPTKFNTDLKILSTEQYIPPFLKKCCGSTGEFSQYGFCEYIFLHDVSIVKAMSLLRIFVCVVCGALHT